MINKIKAAYEKIPSFLKNRFAVTLLLFFTWMMFFDTHNFVSRFSNIDELHEARAKKGYFIHQIESVKNDLQDLMSNNETLEKFAREKYMMKMPDEDIFIIVEE